MRTMILRAVAGVVLVFAVVTLLRLTGSLERMELAAFDIALRLRPPAEADPRIVILDETEDDLQRWGHPMSDETLARIIERIFALEPRIVGVDKYRDLPVAPGSEVLERLIKDHQNLVWIYKFGSHGTRSVGPPSQLAASERIGFNDVVDDPGGVVRRGLLYLDDGGQPQPSFPLLLAMAYLAKDRIFPRGDPENQELLRLGKTTLPPFERNDGGYASADAGGYQLLLDYRGIESRFQRVTVTELLEGHIDPAMVRDRIVILGASAESLKDHFYTPFSSSGNPSQRITGAELHGHLASQLIRLANAESTVLKTFREPTEFAFIAIACIAGMAGWFATSGYRFAAILIIGTFVASLVWYFCALDNLWFPVVPLIGGFTLSAAVSTAVRAAHEARERKTLMNLFSRHVSPEVANELWVRRRELLDGYALRPRALEVTILFADIRGYSTLAERLSPSDTARWLNQVMGAMAETIMSNRGVVRQYVGDEVMAVFGAPVPSETSEAQAGDARHAVQCAIAMRRRLAELNDSWRKSGLPLVGMRIGINSGPVVACTIGSANRLEYTIVGDSVNLAARLEAIQLPDEGALPDGSCRILLSGGTFARAELEPASVDRIGDFPTKGRHELVTIYRL